MATFASQAVRKTYPAVTNDFSLKYTAMACSESKDSECLLENRRIKIWIAFLRRLPEINDHPGKSGKLVLLTDFLSIFSHFGLRISLCEYVDGFFFMHIKFLAKYKIILDHCVLLAIKFCYFTSDAKTYYTKSRLAFNEIIPVNMLLTPRQSKNFTLYESVSSTKENRELVRRGRRHSTTSTFFNVFFYIFLRQAFTQF